MTAAAVMPMAGFAARWVIGACWFVAFEGAVGDGDMVEFDEGDRSVVMVCKVEEEGKLNGEGEDEIADSSLEIRVEIPDVMVEVV
jgi:hypothetical protein